MGNKPAISHFWLQTKVQTGRGLLVFQPHRTLLRRDVICARPCFFPEADSIPSDPRHTGRHSHVQECRQFLCGLALLSGHPIDATFRLAPGYLRLVTGKLAAPSVYRTQRTPNCLQQRRIFTKKPSFATSPDTMRRPTHIFSPSLATSYRQIPCHRQAPPVRSALLSGFLPSSPPLLLSGSHLKKLSKIRAIDWRPTPCLEQAANLPSVLKTDDKVLLHHGTQHSLRPRKLSQVRSGST